MAVFFRGPDATLFSLPASIFHKFGIMCMYATMSWCLWKIALETTEDESPRTRNKSIIKILKQMTASTILAKPPPEWNLDFLPDPPGHPIFSLGSSYRQLFCTIKNYYITQSGTSFHLDSLASNQILWGILEKEGNPIADIFRLFVGPGKSVEIHSPHSLLMENILPFARCSNFDVMFPYSENINQEREMLLGLGVFLMDATRVEDLPFLRSGERPVRLSTRKLVKAGKSLGVGLSPKERD